MLNGISRHKFQDMSQLVRLEGKHTVQTAHCALQCIGGSGLTKSSPPFLRTQIFHWPLRHSKLKDCGKTFKVLFDLGDGVWTMTPTPLSASDCPKKIFGNSGCLLTFLSCLFSGFQDKIPLAPSTEWHCKCSNHILRVYSVNKAFDLTLHIHTTIQ